jgi:hypothetical protein
MHLITRLGAFDEAMLAALNDSRHLDKVGIVGYGVAHLLDGDGRTKQLVPFANLVTTAGDEYYAKKGITDIAPANPTAPTAASGMKLGQGSTAAAKSGAGALLITYITGSNNLFDTSFPAAAAVGGDGGWNATYKTTWAAGDVTNADIEEVVIVNDAAADATSTAANTYSRAVIAAVNKTASDSLAVTWNHKVLGA